MLFCAVRTRGGRVGPVGLDTKPSRVREASPDRTRRADGASRARRHPAMTRLRPGRKLAPDRRVADYGELTHRVCRVVGRRGGAVSADRRKRLRDLLAVHNGAFALLCGICELCVSELAVTGARVRVLGGFETKEGGVLVHATDPLGAELDDLAATAGAGPCVDAFELGHPVLVSDLAAERVRWPGFTANAVSAGVVAVFSFPLRVGGARLGVLELHRTAPGALSPAHLADAFQLADAATETIFDDMNAVAPTTLPAVVDIQAVVHQATGFVAVDLEVSLQEALMRIRGYAFAHQKTLSEVAKDIIERRLRLEPGE